MTTVDVTVRSTHTEIVESSQENNRGSIDKDLLVYSTFNYEKKVRSRFRSYS